MRREAILIKINDERYSRNGGRYNRTYWKDIKSNESYIFDVYPDHYASKRFVPYIKEGVILGNLRIIEINKRKFISGYSNFILIKKNKRNESNN